MESMDSDIRLLIVSYYYPPIEGAGLPGSQRVVKFVRHLPIENITVLTVNQEIHSPARLADTNTKIPIKSEKIVRTRVYDVFGWLLNLRKMLNKIFYHGKACSQSTNIATPDKSNDRTFAEKIKDYVYELCHFPDGASGWLLPGIVVGRKLLKRDRPDIIFATGMPWTALLVACVLHKISGIPFVADFRDPWVGNPFHSSKGRMLDSLSVFLERIVIESATLVSANTELLKDEFLVRYPHLSPEHFIVLPNGFDPGDFIKYELEKYVKEETTDKLVITHAGYFYGDRDPAVLFEAIALLAREDIVWLNRFRFVHMGQTSLNYDIRDRFKESLESGLFEDLGQVPYRQCLEQLKESDVLLILQGCTKTQVPSKLYDYLCINRPILTLTPKDGALGQMIEKYSFGSMLEPKDSVGLADQLKAFWSEKQLKGQLISEYPQKDRFNVRNITAILADRLNDITKKTLG